MAAPAPPAITFWGVTKRYRNGVAGLNDVSFAIPAGARAGLLGPNGAGKSTAVRLLQGGLSPTQGRVTLLNFDTTDPQFADVRRRVGIVPQAAGPYRDLSAREYLELARDIFGAGDVAAAADRFGLRPHLDKVMADLSGGLQRRLLLAAAVLSDPQLLILDEPSLGLDPVAAEDVRSLLLEIGPGRTLLMCTNNLAEAQAVCDYVVILDRGRVVLQQTMEALRRGRRRIALRAVQGIEALERFAHDRGLSVTREAPDLVIELSGEEREIPELLRAALQAGLDITECRQVERDLQTAFFDVVGKA